MYIYIYNTVRNRPDLDRYQQLPLNRTYIIRPDVILHSHVGLQLSSLALLGATVGPFLTLHPLYPGTSLCSAYMLNTRNAEKNTVFYSYEYSNLEYQRIYGIYRVHRRNPIFLFLWPRHRNT